MKRIKLWLKDNKRSSSYLARECDVSPAAMHYWLNGTFKPSEKHRKKLQEVTGVKL